MSIVRDIPKTLVALEERSLITCSTASQVFSGSTANVIDPDGGTTGVAGRVIDRLNDLLQRYTVVSPSAQLNSTRGSTEADRKLTLGIKLQHGDSSGGGDMADYSTAVQQDNRVFFTTAQTTPMANWSTGTFQAETLPSYYDLRGAKRYIRAVVFAIKNGQTTESSGDEGARVRATLTFMGADNIPEAANVGAGSTSTST